MDEIARAALEKFGKALMERVRDYSIQQCNMVVDGTTKAKGKPELYRRLGNLSDEQRAALHDVVRYCVDDTIHFMLWMIDQEEWLNLAVRTDNGTVPSLREVSDGLVGDHFDWIEQFSKYPEAP